MRAKGSGRFKQFHRLEHEFHAPVTLEHLEYTVARRTDSRSAPMLDSLSGVEVLRRAGDDELLALMTTKWRLDAVLREHPDLIVEPLVADTD